MVTSTKPVTTFAGEKLVGKPTGSKRIKKPTGVVIIALLCAIWVYGAVHN